MTRNTFDRMIALGQELQQLAAEMRDALGDVKTGRETDYTTWGLCEARVIGIAAELRVIIAGTKGV